jgi:hypothetical protein
MVRLAYDHANLPARWQLDDFVELNQTQQQQFDRDFDRIWAWHRKHELPRYAALLRDIATATSGPIDSRQLAHWRQRIDGFVAALQTQVQPPATTLLASLDDHQVAHLLDAVRQRQSRDLRHAARRTLAQARADKRKSLRHLLDDWLGRSTAAQRDLVDRAAAHWRPTATMQQVLARRAMPQITALLATRRQPGFGDRLAAALRPATTTQSPLDAALRAAQDVDQDLNRHLLLALSATLQPGQRRHLQRRLLKYATDCDALASESADD